MTTTASQRPRNDPGLYDDLAAHWWDQRGPFAMLHWIARARAELIPPATRDGEILVDLGCGAGLLAPYVALRGYRHIGVDLTASALTQAAAHGVTPVRASVEALCLSDGIAQVVSAGEILEHVTDLSATIAEACRVLAPGGLLVLDTIADTALARLLAVGVAERVPGGAPPGIHDPALFVNRVGLVEACARHGVTLTLSGLRPSVSSLLSWRMGRRAEAEMVRTFSTAVLFQGYGRKQ
jgi:2-polyprenyl-6-hydroxyphenyl methylase/3-demethylubiquinone-9 3-methyltransferase